MFDVAIVGAGPCGSTSAAELAKHGARVVLLDAATFPRRRSCGGGVLSRASKHLPAEANAAVVRQCRTLELHLHGPRIALRSSRTAPIITMVDRAAFDAELASVAERAGAVVRFGEEVRELATSADGVELKTARETLKARFVIAADGATGSTAGRAGFAPIPQGLLGIELDYEASPEAFERLSQSVRFDFDVIDHGYGSLFPKRDHLSVGVVAARANAQQLRAALQDYLKRLDLPWPANAETRVQVIPAEPRPGALVKNRVLVSGEAAGFADPLSGEGLSYALNSGRMAARALVAGAYDEAQTLEHYKSEVDAEISGELNIGRSFSRLFYGYPRLRNMMFRFAGQTICDLMTDVAMGSQRYSDYLDPSSASLSVPQLFKKMMSSDVEVKRT
jgi:geranylgeranyl reductase family protein